MSVCRKMVRTMLLAAFVAATVTGCGQAAPHVNPANTRPAFTGPGQIALVQNGNLFSLGGKDGRLHQLTTAGNVSQPGFSPDGQWLSFLLIDQLWLVRTDGSDLHRVSDVPGPLEDFSYAWSPVSDVLAVAPQSVTGGIWLVSPQGPSESVKGSPLSVVRSLAWSPDGRQLAFVAPAARQPSPQALPPNDSLFTAAWQDNTLTGLRQHYLAAGNGIILAGWAPGGLLFWIDPDHSASIAADGLALSSLDIGSNRIQKLPVTLTHPEWILPAPPANTYFVQGDGREMWLNKGLAEADLTTGKVTGLPLPAGSVYFSPALSPDRHLLAFVYGPRLGPHDPDPAMQTWARQLSLGVTRPDGTGFRALTRAGRGVGSPVFTGDGKNILYVRDGALWMIGVDGTKPTRLANFDTAFNNYYGYLDSIRFFAYHP